MTEKRTSAVRRGRPRTVTADAVTSGIDPEEARDAVLKAATKYTGLVMARAIVKEYLAIMEKR